MADRRLAARMQLVEVEDAPTTTIAPPRPADAAPLSQPSPGGSARRVRRWWLVAAAVVLAVVVSGVVASARDRAFVARISGVPGLLRPLDAAPEPLWETRGSPQPGTVLAADGAIVVLTEGEDEWTVTAHEPLSGAQRWSAVVAPASRSGFEATAAVCPGGSKDVGDLVVCLVRLPRVVYSDDASIQEPPRVAIVPLSAQDGARLGEWDVRGEIVGFDRVGDDLVIGTLDADGRMLVQRRDARTGDVVWSMRTTDVMDAPAIVISATMRVLPTVVVLAGGSTMVLDIDDGRALAVSARFSGLQVASLGDRFATWAPVGGGHVHDEVGTALYAVEGLPAELAADDGSQPGTVVVDAGPEVVGVDVTTGAEQWRTRSMLDPRLLVSDRLVVSSASTYGVLDATDGTPLWDVEAGSMLPWSPLCDGTLVVGPGLSPTGGAELWGRGLDDGVRYWSVPLPEGVRHVEAIGGRLVVRTADDLIVYG